MAVYKEINRADGSGVTTFYRISDVLDTAETDDQEGQAVIIDYNQAQNKPSINGVTLIGNKTIEDLGLQPAGDYITNDEADKKFIDEDELEAKNYVNQAELQDAIAHIEHFHREIVEALPVTGMDNVLYMVRKGGTGEDIYNEYIWVGLSSSENGYEFLGTTATDLTDYYKKSQVDAALATKVDKEGGKGLSEQNYTLAEKTKLAGLENYDDTEIQAEVSGLNTDVNNLKSSNVIISNTLAELKPDVESNTAAVSTIYDLLDNKMTAIRLVEQGDGWVWMNLEGSRLTYAQASAALGHENCMLFIEQLENDGKVIPAEYKSEGDHINVIFKDLDSLVHVMTCGEDDAVVTEDVATTDGQVNFTVEDEAIGYTTKMTAIYGNTLQEGTPTPDSPQDIHVVSGDNTIKVEGKNLLGLQENTYSLRGITASVSNGEITLNGTANGDIFISLYTDNTINWVDSQTYTINAFNPILNSNVRIRLANRGSKNVILDSANKTAQIEYSEDLGLYTDRIQIRVQSGTTLTNFKLQPMLVKGSTAPTDYEPYQSTTYPINLGSMELCKIGNCQDKIYKQNDSWYLHKEIGKKVFDGVNGIVTSKHGTITSPTKGLYQTTLPGKATRGSSGVTDKAISNNMPWLTGGAQAAFNNNDYGYWWEGGTSYIYVVIEATTVADANTWFTTHNSTVYYELETPTDTEITDPTLLAQLNALEQITQYKHTYITISGADLTPEADFTYIDNVVINNTDLVLGKDTYWNDEVPTQQDLPSNAQEGEIRIVQDTENVYIYNGTKWISFDKGGEVDLSNYLAKDNTTSWMPTGPFNPSTKKYVDDSISGIYIPTKTSQLTNDSNFITKSVNDLTNYYLKTNIYTKAEVDALIQGGGGGSNISITVNGDTLVISTQSNAQVSELR